jgi:hypothetical protein
MSRIHGVRRQPRLAPVLGSVDVTKHNGRRRTCPTLCAMRMTGSGHYAVLSLSGQMGARTPSSRISAAGRKYGPVEGVRCAYFPGGGALAPSCQRLGAYNLMPANDLAKSNTSRASRCLSA